MGTETNINVKNEPVARRGENISIGQWFYARTNDSAPLKLFLATYCSELNGGGDNEVEFVEIRDPRRTYGYSIDFADYRPVSSIEINATVST